MAKVLLSEKMERAKNKEEGALAGGLRRGGNSFKF